jgi:hypothetical protein
MLKDLFYLILIAALIGGGWYVFQTAQLPGVQSPWAMSESATRTALMGTWQSVENPDLIREFEADNVIVDRFASNPAGTANGSWQVYTALTAPSDIEFQPKANSTYVRLMMPTGTTDFIISSLSAHKLQLTTLDRGNILNFAKLP